MGETRASCSEVRILALSLENSAIGVATHTKCRHLQNGYLLDRLVIHYSPDSHSSFAQLARKLHLLGHPGKGQRLV